MSKLNKDHLDDWHRYFAVEANNRAWHLATQNRSAEEDAELLNLAHGSAFHWNSIGTELHKMRAKMLLAEVHALFKFGESAYQYAEQMRTFFLSQENIPDWEIAFVYAVHAHAAHAAENYDQHRLSYGLATQAIEKIAGDEDRKVVLQTFDQVPVP